MNVNSDEKKVVWGVYTNTDLTEGRGEEYIKYFCEHKETAIRLSHKGYIMGSDCPIKEIILYKKFHSVDSVYKWFGPVHLIPPSDKDTSLIKERTKFDDIVNKMKDAGLTDEDISTYVNFEARVNNNR